MRRLKIIEHISLDGVIQHSADDGDFPTATGPRPIGPLLAEKQSSPRRAESFDLLLGRRTYDIWSASGRRRRAGPMADRLNAATKIYRDPSSGDS